MRLLKRAGAKTRPSSKFTLPEVSLLEAEGGMLGNKPLFARVALFFEHLGGLGMLAIQALRTLFTTRFEFRAFIYQLDQVGVRSLGIATSTATFVGIVMCIQFALTLERYGARDTIGRIIGLSETRELAPSLTALVVGSRVAAGMAAELGSMSVTEQIDAIRALGADPIKKLVVPRLVACTIALPLLTFFALACAIVASMFVAALSYDVTPTFFWTSLTDVVQLRDIGSGFGKTPFFGFLIAIVGCYFGMLTRGGTEGVGRSTTSAVVIVSVTVLVADAFLTKLFISFY